MHLVQTPSSRTTPIYRDWVYSSAAPTSDLLAVTANRLPRVHPDKALASLCYNSRLKNRYNVHISDCATKPRPLQLYRQHDQSSIGFLQIAPLGISGDLLHADIVQCAQPSSNKVVEGRLPLRVPVGLHKRYCQTRLWNAEKKCSGQTDHHRSI